MKITPKHMGCVEKLAFTSEYPHKLTKVEKKERTIKELNQVIQWLTGFDDNAIQELMEEKVICETFLSEQN